MEVTKCDICKKNIKSAPVRASFVSDLKLNRIELCEKCGIPITEFFVKNKLIKNKKQFNHLKQNA